jgi:hypothetical protein
MKFFKSNWKILSQYIESHEKQGDVILFFNSINFKLPFNYHYKGLNATYNIPNDSNYEKYDFRQTIIQSDEQIIDFFEKRNPISGRIWLIGRQNIFNSVEGRLNLNGEILKKYLNERFDLVEKRQFENTAVVHLFMSKDSIE